MLALAPEPAKANGIQAASYGSGSEEPRPAAAAVGASRQGRVLTRRLVAGLIGRSVSPLNASRRPTILGGFAVAAGVARIKSIQERSGCSRFAACQSRRENTLLVSA